MKARSIVGRAAVYAIGLAVMFGCAWIGAEPVNAKAGLPAETRIAHQVAAIDALLPKMDMHDRLLSGLSADGASVDAYRSEGRLEKIVVETLNESGHKVADYYFDHGTLIRVRVRDYKYKTGLNGDPLPVKPSGHPATSPDGKVVADTIYEFADDKLIRRASLHSNSASPDIDIAKQQADMLTHAKSFVLLMNTPGPEGSGAWECARGQADDCTAYQLEDATPSR